MYNRERKILINKITSISETIKSVAIEDYAEKTALCVFNLIEIHKSLVERCADYDMSYIQGIINALEALNDNFEARNAKAQIKDITKKVHSLKIYVNSQPVRYKAIFLPYISSMWTALESVWKAADEDPNCDAYVVPIPYWNLLLDKDGNANKADMVYEGDKYPQYVPVFDYQSLSIEAEQPDMIFIHNPYDDYNTLTRIPEQFYTRNLKPHTDNLIYSPYNVPYITPNYTKAPMMPSFNIIDKFLFSSKGAADWYIRSGLKKEKALTLGSPKIDAVVAPIKPVQIPKDWQEKARGKKVILLNTHFYGFLTAFSFYKKYNINVGLDITSQIIKIVTGDDDLMLLWRPHPLMISMIESRGLYELSDKVKKLMSYVEKSGGIVDFSSDYLTAFELSDALISLDTSSLLTEYLFTGKPTTEIATYSNRNSNAEFNNFGVREFLYTKHDIHNSEDFKSSLIFDIIALHHENDHNQTECYLNYFRQTCEKDIENKTHTFEELEERYNIAASHNVNVPDTWLNLQKVFIEKFGALVKSNNDYLKNIRMNAINKFFSNSDGSCGRKIYDYFKIKL